MSSTETAKNVSTGSYKQRDKYGRTVTNFTVNARTVAVVVSLPKVYADNYGHKYLVNDWAGSKKGDEAVTYFVKRSEAVKHAESIVAREVLKADEAQAEEHQATYGV